MNYFSSSTEQTKKIAADFATTLSGGECIMLQGELGSGKTTFVQGVCEALGVKEHVTSPTFAIMNIYHLPKLPTPGVGKKVVHLDLYRLKTVAEIAALGLEEYMGQTDTIMLVEWPDMVDGIDWKPTYTITFTSTNENERIISISP